MLNGNNNVNLTSGSFTYNVSGGTLTITTAGNGEYLTIGSGPLILTNGQVVHADNLKLATDVTIVRDGGSLDTAPWFESWVNVTYTGSGTYTTGPEIPVSTTALKDLVIAKSDGTLTLGAPATVNGTLNLGTNNITTGTANTLAIALNGTVVNTTVGNTTGHVIGNLQKYVPFGPSVARTFEIGTANEYSPTTVVFGNVTAAGDLIATATQTVHPHATTPLNTLKRYWSFSPDGALAYNSYSATFYYLSGDFNTGVSESFDEATLVVGQYSSGWTFPTIGARNAGTTNDGGSIQVTGLTSFSDFAIGKDNAALPVQMTSFVVNANRLNAELKWTTATEVNCYGFEIQRRLATGAEAAWTKVGFVQGAGTTDSPKDYSFTDVKLTPARYTYRIKQVDTDGKFEYYTPAEVEIGLAAKVLMLAQNYPNPFNPSTNIEFTLPADGRAVLKVYNILGQEVAELFNGEAQAGRIIQARFDAAGVSTGLCFYRLQFGGKTLIKRMLLVK